LKRYYFGEGVLSGGDKLSSPQALTEFSYFASEPTLQPFDGFIDRALSSFIFGYLTLEIRQRKFIWK